MKFHLQPQRLKLRSKAASKSIPSLSSSYSGNVADTEDDDFWFGEGKKEETGRLKLF